MFTTPSAIQAQAIPALIDGRDVMGLAQTGTGKTAAFSLPMLTRLLAEGRRPEPGTCRALILAGGYDAKRAESDLAAGRGDLIAVGKLFLANPDLVERFKAGAELSTARRSAYYGGGAKGYTDYPAL